jgi:predicted DNA-binding transcriptional regulator AlpA
MLVEVPFELPRLMEFLMTVEDVADALAMSRREVYRREAKGQIPRGIRLGPCMVRWKGTEIEAFLAGLPR